MPTYNPQIDLYLKQGCMRCKYGATPQCKVHAWHDELVALREIVLEAGLKEELKWSVPCYTHDGKNMLIVAAFKDWASINFFKGSLLKDEKKLLTSPGENSQSGMYMKFTQLKDIINHKATIKSYIKELIALEKAGAKVEFKKIDEVKLPDELEQKFKESPAFKKAFKALTPGRQRGYIIHFAQAKQSATRIARIEKYEDKIMQGKGMMD